MLEAASLAIAVISLLVAIVALALGNKGNQSARYAFAGFFFALTVVFALIGVFALVGSNIGAGPSAQIGNPDQSTTAAVVTLTPPPSSNSPQTIATNTSLPTVHLTLAPPSSGGLLASTEVYYCYGECWQYDDDTRTMTWIGPTDGLEDIWQPPGEALHNIRDGYTAILSPSVPGEIFACVLTVNGAFIKNTCDGILYQVAPGTYQITSNNRDIGGFRWCPAIDYGWRVNGGECR